MLAINLFCSFIRIFQLTNMRKLSLMLICLFIAGLSYAQYIPYQPGKTPYFRGNNGVQAVQISQQDTIDGAIHCKFMPQFDYSNYACITLSINSWLGKEMVLTQDICTFLNNQGDSIHFLTQLQVGTQWQMAEFADGSRFEAQVTAIGTSIVFGAIDTVASIQLNYFDSTGVDANHPAEAQELSIGKHNGFLTSFNWSIFPTNILLIHLVGRNDIPGSITYLSRKEIYNFDIGDVFHYEESTIHYTNQTTYDYTLRKVLNKVVTANGDSVVYTYLDTLYGQLLNEGVVTDYFETQQWTQSFDFSNDPVEFPGCANISPYSACNILNYYSASQPARRIKVLDLEVSNDSIVGSEDCWNTPIGPFGMSYYMEGVGLTVMDEVNYNLNNFKLVYYQKGEESWGTPLHYMSVENPELQKVRVYPNPSRLSDPITVQIPNPGTYRIQVYNAQAQLLESLASTGEESILFDALPATPGLYFIKIFSATESLTLKLIRL